MRVNNEEQRTFKEEVRTAMKRMKNGKAVSPNYLPVEVWMSLGKGYSRENLIKLKDF